MSSGRQSIHCHTQIQTYPLKHVHTHTHTNTQVHPHVNRRSTWIIDAFKMDLFPLIVYLKQTISLYKSISHLQNGLSRYHVWITARLVVRFHFHYAHIFHSKTKWLNFLYILHDFMVESCDVWKNFVNKIHWMNEIDNGRTFFIDTNGMNFIFWTCTTTVHAKCNIVHNLNFRKD